MLLRLRHALAKQGCGIYASPWPSPCSHSPSAHHLSLGCTGEPQNTPDADAHQPPTLSAADSLATSALQLLLHLSAHAGCQAAIVQEAATLRSLFWLVYRPTSQRCLQDAIKLLRAASGTDSSAQRTAFRPLRQNVSRFTLVWYFKPATWLSHPRLLAPVCAGQTPVALVAACQGGALYLVCTLLQADAAWPFPPPEGSQLQAVQLQAALLLARLAGAPAHGATVAMLVQVRNRQASDARGPCRVA